jgi:hypothetical protein
MPNINSLYANDTINAGLFKDKPVTLTIKAIKAMDVDNSGKLSRRPRIDFVETEKYWIVNVTNGQILEAMFGAETDNYPGKKITLGCQQVYFGGDETEGIIIVGSPDIEKDIEVMIKLKKKKPKRHKITVTKKATKHDRQPGEEE